MYYFIHFEGVQSKRFQNYDKRNKKNLINDTIFLQVKGVECNLQCQQIPISFFESILWVSICVYSNTVPFWHCSQFIRSIASLEWLVVSFIIFKYLLHSQFFHGVHKFVVVVRSVNTTRQSQVLFKLKTVVCSEIVNHLHSLSFYEFLLQLGKKYYN